MFHWRKNTKQLIRIFLAGQLLALLMLDPVRASEPPTFSISGWKEVLISVRNLKDYDDFFAEADSWRLVDQGQVGRPQLNAWNLTDSTTAKYRLYANSGTTSGFIRLVQFFGVEQVLMRPDSQSWDTGGIFDINMRTHDLEQLASRLRAQGWQARSPITEFSFGPFVVKEWIPQNPDGFAVAFIQRIAPPLEGWPHFTSLSRPFNSTQVVRDIKKSLKFYEDVLGFKRYLEHKGASKEPGENVLGLPHNMTNKVPREVYILNPIGVNEGSVELLAFDGAIGRDNSDLAKLPNIGIAALSFPVVGIEALQSHLENEQVTFIHKIKVIDGTAKMIVSSPEGSWLEFYE